MPIIFRHELGVNSRMSTQTVSFMLRDANTNGRTLSVKRDFTAHGVVIPKEERLHR